MKKAKSHRGRDNKHHPQRGATGTSNGSHDAGGTTPLKTVDDEAPRYTYRPNWLLIGTLLLVSIVLAGGSFLLRRYQLARHSQIYRTQAYAAFERGQLPQAIVWMRRYLRFNPADVDALADFGVWVEKSGNDGDTYLLAFLTYESVLRKSPERRDLRRKSVDVAMILGRYSDALHHLEKLLENSPQDTELIGKSAVCEAKLGHYAKAIQLYRRAIDLEPQNLDWYWGLIQVAQVAKAELRPADLDPQTKPSEPSGEEVSAANSHTARTFDELLHDWLNRMVEQGQPTWRALLMRSQFYLDAGDTDAAETDLDSARRLGSNAVELDLQLVQIKLQRAEQSREAGRPVEAEELTQAALAIVEKALQDNADDLRLHVTLAQILAALNRPDDAEKTIRDGIQRCAAQMDNARQQGEKAQLGRLSDLRSELYFLLTDTLINRINNESNVAQLTKEIEDVLSQAAKYGLTEVRQNYLRGRLLIAQRAWRQAQRTLEKIRPEVETIRHLRQRTDLLLGQCAEMLQNPDQRVAVFRRALASDAAWLLGRLHLADALAKAGQWREAIDHYRALIQVRGVSAALAELLIGEQLRLPESERQWQPVRNFLREAALREPDSFLIQVRQAQIATLEGKFDEAERLLQTARERFPEEVAVWEASVRMVLARTDWDLKDRRDAAERLLVDAVQRFGDRVELRLAQAAVVNHLPPHEQESVLQQLGQQVDQFSTEDRVRLWDGLAQIALQLGNTSLAQNFWEQAAAAQPLNLAPRLALANLAIERRDKNALAELTTAVRTIEGDDGPHGHYLEASSLLLSLEDLVNLGQEPLSSSNRDVDRAVNLLRQVSQQRPLWPVPHAMLGELAYHLGDRESAVEHFRRARTLGDTSPRLLARLASTLCEMGRIAEADAELRKAITLNQLTTVDPELARIAWQVAWQQRDFSTAESIASQVAASTRDVRDLIWLSRLRQVRGDVSEKAEEPLRQAVQLAPSNPSTWRALITFLVLAKRTAEAAQLVDEAVKALPEKPPFVRLVFQAECAEILQDFDTAERLLQQAFDSEPSNFRLRVVMADFLTRRGKYAQAEPHLRFLMDPSNQVPPLTIEWARSRLAEGTASRGAYEDVLAALQTVPDSPSLSRHFQLLRLRTRAAILIKRTTWRERNQLIGVLEQIHAIEPLPADDRFVLASLYLLTGDRERALPILRDLVKLDPSRDDWVASLVRAILQTDSAPTKTDLDTARQWVNHLLTSHPDAVTTIEAQLRLLAAQGEKKEAEQLVQAFLAKRADQQTTVALHQKLARLCYDLGLDSAAETVYLNTLEKDPSSPLVFEYIRYLGNRGHLQRAVEWVERARHAGVEPPRLIRLVTALLMTNEVSPADLDRLSKWVADVVNRDGASREGLLGTAELNLVHGQFSQAEKTYRQVLLEEPTNVIALNNLAWMYAHQGRELTEALRLIDKAISIAGPYGQLLDTRASVLAAAQQSDEAIRHWEEAARDTESGYIWMHLAQGYYRAGRTSDAIAAYNKALRHGFQLRLAPPPERGQLRQFQEELSKLASGPSS